MESGGSVRSTRRTCACCDFRAKSTEDKSTWTKTVTKDEAVEKLRHWVQQQDPTFKKQFLSFSKDLDGRVNWYNFRKVGGRASRVCVSCPRRVGCSVTRSRCQGVALGFPFSAGRSRSCLGLSAAEKAPLGQCRRPLSAEDASARRPRCPRGQMGWDQASQAPRCRGSARRWGLSRQRGGEAGRKGAQACAVGTGEPARGPGWKGLQRLLRNQLRGLLQTPVPTPLASQRQHLLRKAFHSRVAVSVWTNSEEAMEDISKKGSLC